MQNMIYTMTKCEQLFFLLFLCRRIGLLEAEKEKQTKQPEQPPVKTEPMLVGLLF